MEALWFDTFVHADDIRHGLGRPTELGPGLAGTLSHVQHELGRAGWSGAAPAGGPEAMEFVLMATGRLAAAGPSAPPNLYA